MSKVFHIYVLMDDEKILCSCKKDTYKVCPKRVREDLNCIESVVRVSPIDRTSPDEKVSASVRSLDKSVSDLQSALKTAGKHLEKIGWRKL
jgi:hypothetical protein